MDKEVSIHNIEVFEEQITKDLLVLKTYSKKLKENLEEEDHKYFYLTVSFGIESYEAYLKWAKKAKEVLK